MNKDDKVRFAELIDIPYIVDLSLSAQDTVESGLDEYIYERRN